MSNLIVADPKSQLVLGLAGRVAETNATVLLAGHSGVGKEVYARFIHAHSSRREQAFIAVNCAAIPEQMLEAMLFGYEKGAFTGALTAHPGKFEQANGGTLLLDEISEMDIGLQAKLLRAIQEREIERLGSTKTIKLDVRLIATTNRDLKQQVKDGEFREDLFYRLSVFPIAIPALKDRPADILPLASYFISRDRHVHNPDNMLTREAIAKLQAYNWPGNVRELDNVIQRALILRQGQRIQAEDIQFDIGLDFNESLYSAVASTDAFAEPRQDAPSETGFHRDTGLTVADEFAHEPQLDAAMRDQEMRLIDQALKEGKSKKHAAEILGISPRTLRYKIARLREQGCAI
ncbi:sigma-54-dependent Fis family transcriptional regulator [Spongiibacter sp. KMU-158]|uniref:Sigma-54-dependent Fis family transcriptional regulator n=1 Tax=Spongiibacter pelagi TaxID=2760804 RepID=A0A927C2S8_9GAMM|nr:sigma-54 dependent transcriptional regulator [Spongiibacter pelagi]MBD2858430.1 sigma-54-dependent Fis family transcriptional regulator [Spongiibacter pelagi]